MLREKIIGSQEVIKFAYFLIVSCDCTLEEAAEYCEISPSYLSMCLKDLYPEESKERLNLETAYSYHIRDGFPNLLQKCVT